MEIVWLALVLPWSRSLRCRRSTVSKKISERRRADTESPSKPRLRPGVETLPNQAPEVPTTETTGSMYRWRDADGAVRIESAPRTTGIEFETITFQKIANRQAGETPA